MFRYNSFYLTSMICAQNPWLLYEVIDDNLMWEPSVHGSYLPRMFAEVWQTRKILQEFHFYFGVNEHNHEIFSYFPMPLVFTELGNVIQTSIGGNPETPLFAGGPRGPPSHSSSQQLILHPPPASLPPISLLFHRSY